MCLWQTYFQVKDHVFLDVTSQRLARTKVLFPLTRMESMYLSNTTLFDGRGVYKLFTT